MKTNFKFNNTENFISIIDSVETSEDLSFPEICNIVTDKVDETVRYIEELSIENKERSIKLTEAEKTFSILLEYFEKKNYLMTIL